MVTNWGLKPIFHEERLILTQAFHEDGHLPECLYRSGNNVYFKGRPLFRFTIQEGRIVVVGNRERVIERIRRAEQLECDMREHLNRTFSANRSVLASLNDEAISFVRVSGERFRDKERFISFSGGKDSTVTAVIVKRALGQVPMLFCNTTIELPETVDYVHDFAEWIGLRLIELTPRKDFCELMRDLGPPSRMMRWCCFTQKSAPINDYLKKFNQGVISYDGIRRAESMARMKYDRQHENTKITKQTSIYPLLEWSDLAVWLFLLNEGVPFNRAYRWGLSRVGCWACPNEGKISAFFLELQHPEMFRRWQMQLEEFAMTNGKDESWVKDGEWKKRRAAYQYSESAMKTQLCGQGRDFIYRLKNREIDKDMINFLAIFGDMEEGLNGSDNLVKIAGAEIDISTFFGSKEIMVHLTGDNGHDVLRLLEKQIEKGMNCIKCGACVGSCSRGAISVDEGFHIDKSHCTSCLICARGIFLKQSCTTIHYRRERNVIGAAT